MLDMTALAGIGIDTAEGLSYCADDPEFYEEMLREYLNECGDRLAELRTYFDGRDWARYAVCAHSVKSTSRMIGAKDISELARAMELAGRQEDGAAILAGHGGFVERYEDTAARLRAVVGPAEG